MNRPLSHRRLTATAAVASAMLVLVPVKGRCEDLPEGVVQLLPRGGIPAVFAPRFVAAADANIPHDAWVLGVVIEGDARAYDLNLLNHHEIVNDVIAGKPVASVW